MKLRSLLKLIGLDSKESSLYLKLLEQGPLTISKIAEYTNMHRPAIYKIIPQLIEKNLISFSIKGKRKIYIAESPKKLEKLFSQKKEEFEEFLPQLIQLYDNRNPQPKIKSFSGKKVTTWVYEDVLSSCKKGDVFYRYESPKDYKKNDEYLPKEYFKRICTNKEIQKFVITNQKTARSKKKVQERVSRIVPMSYDLFEYNISQIIYNNKVAFIDFETNTAWIIESPRFAKFQKQIFKLLFAKLAT